MATNKAQISDLTKAHQDNAKLHESTLTRLNKLEAEIQEVKRQASRSPHARQLEGRTQTDHPGRSHGVPGQGPPERPGPFGGSAVRKLPKQPEDVGVASARRTQQNVLTALKTMGPVSQAPGSEGTRLWVTAHRIKAFADAYLEKNGTHMTSPLKSTGEAKCGVETRTC